MKYAYIKDNASVWPISFMTGLLKVSRTAYYHWLNVSAARAPTRRERAALHVMAIHEETKGTYGHLRTYALLRRKGIVISKYMVRVIRQSLNLQVRPKKRIIHTTDSNHNLPKFDNVLDRNFDRADINVAWGTDITYIPTNEGWLFLAAFKDLHSKEIVGYCMMDGMPAELCLNALAMAIERKRPPRGLIVHSDQGSQYCSRAYRDMLDVHGFVGSMSRKGECHDNAPVESFWSRLKDELLKNNTFQTRAQAVKEITEYIEITYNRTRIQAGLGFRTPTEVAEKKDIMVVF